MEKLIRTITVFFDTRISDREVPFFRGAVLKSLGDKADVLYHNHTGETSVRNSYPPIQYKQIGGRAAIVYVEEGIDHIEPLLSAVPHSILIGSDERDCRMETIKPQETPVSIHGGLRSYRLHNWLPLNSENYIRYRRMGSLVERIQLLERILKGNILSFLKGVGIRVEEQIEVHITDILRQEAVTYKMVELLALDIAFRANISLPDRIGLGKNASIGCGLLSSV